MCAVVGTVPEAEVGDGRAQNHAEEVRENISKMLRALIKGTDEKREH